jgi:hypothetical protein
MLGALMALLKTVDEGQPDHPASRTHRGWRASRGRQPTNPALAAAIPFDRPDCAAARMARLPGRAH